MNTNISTTNVVTEVTTQPTGAETPPTTTSSQTLAGLGAALGAELAAWVAKLPDLMIPHPLGQTQIRATRAVPISFVGVAVNAVESSDQLQLANKLDLPAGHDAVDYFNAFDPIIKQLQKAASDLRYTAGSKKALVASEALQVYDLSKALSRDITGAPLVEYVDAMKKTLGRGSKKKVTTTPPDVTPPPTTPPQATTPAATPTVAPTSVSFTATVPAGSTTTHS